MRTALALCLFLLGGSSASPALALDIHNDSGGEIFAYAKRFDRASKPIRILGTCGSSCTLALAYSSTCVGPNARLIFHAAHSAGPHNGVWTRWMMGRYPASIKSWVRARGGLTSKLITLQGAELRKRVKACS